MSSPDLNVAYFVPIRVSLKNTPFGNTCIKQPVDEGRDPTRWRVCYYVNDPNTTHHGNHESLSRTPPLKRASHSAHSRRRNKRILLAIISQWMVWKWCPGGRCDLERRQSRQDKQWLPSADWSRCTSHLRVAPWALSVYSLESCFVTSREIYPPIQATVKKFKTIILPLQK